MNIFLQKINNFVVHARILKVVWSVMLLIQIYVSHVLGLFYLMLNICSVLIVLTTSIVYTAVLTDHAGLVHHPLLYLLRNCVLIKAVYKIVIFV